jgi:hypothetical protein
VSSGTLSAHLAAHPVAEEDFEREVTELQLQGRHGEAFTLVTQRLELLIKGINWDALKYAPPAEMRRINGAKDKLTRRRDELLAIVRDILNSPATRTELTQALDLARANGHVNRADILRSAGLPPNTWPRDIE